MIFITQASRQSLSLRRLQEQEVHEKETPVKKFPVFPDMSKIYNTIPGYKQVVVHTLGPSRFLKQYKQKQITSESVGLISPIWHYVGVNVYAKNNMHPDI